MSNLILNNLIMSKRTATAFILLAASLSVPAMAGSGAGNPSSTQTQAPTAAPAATQMAEGLVKKLDKSAGKVTLSHGPLVNLGMPAMTMVFRVKDAAWLDQMKVGDNIRFVADKLNGSFTVVQFELSK